MIPTWESGQLLPFHHSSPAELLGVRAAEQGDRDWLIWRPFEGSPKIWTYRQFDDSVSAVARDLRKRGVGKGDRVCVHSGNSPEFIVSWFALNRLGATIVSTNVRSAPDELTDFLQRTSCRLLIADRGASDAVYSALGPMDTPPELVWINEGPEVSFASLLEPPSAVVGQWPSVSSSDEAGIQFTSGTTARAKGVVWTNANFLWGGKMSAVHEQLTSTDRHLVHLPLFHTNAQIYSVMASLWAGAAIILMPRFSATRFWSVACDEKASVCSMIPFTVKALRDFDVPPHSFRLWINGLMFPRWDERYRVRTMAGWGMTETVAHGIVSDPWMPMRRRAIGAPSPGYRLRIVNDEGAPVSSPGSGLLEIFGTPGVSLFSSYLDDAAATEAAYTDDGWFKTGDRVEVDAAGYVAFLERDKDMLKIGGENVAALEIERVIGTIEGVCEAAVVGRPDRMLDEVPVAFVTAQSGAKVEQLQQDIVRACEDGLADFKVPQAVHVVDELPRSLLNKVAKNVLRDWDQQAVADEM